MIKLDPGQKTYIKNKITAFENALHGSKYLDPYVGYKTFIDVSSFVDYFIMVELSKNTDGYRLSTFLHKDRDGKDPRIHMGPIWDYDLAFGNANYYDSFNTYGWNYKFLVGRVGNSVLVEQDADRSLFREYAILPVA